MSSFKEAVETLNTLLQLIHDKNVPNWISPLIGWVLLIAFVLWGVLKIKETGTQHFKSLFYNPDQKRRLRRRQMFAKHIEYEILRLDLQEDWKDERFAELEAEVEAEGKKKIFSLLP